MVRAGRDESAQRRDRQRLVNEAIRLDGAPRSSTGIK
jgi:hypothetical protein